MISRPLSRPTLLCVALGLALPGPAAQAQAQSTQAAADLPSQAALRLKQAIGTCLTEPDGIDTRTTVTLGFRVLEDGQLDGVPRRIGREVRTGDENELYFHALRDLYNCAPFPNSGPANDFELVVAPDGVKDLYHAKDRPAAQVKRENPLVDPVPPGTRATETALALDRAARREIQLRLRLIGFDPQGVDGIFGPNTRAALSDWQSRAGLTSTGYLNAEQLAQLKTESQAEYAAYEPPRSQSRSTPQRQRVRVCRKTGFLGIKFCRYEYR